VDKLSPDEIDKALAELEGWSRQGETITKTFRFRDFIGSVNFVNALAEVAETMKHHPDIDIRYNKVTLVLTTHDSGGVTARDFELARAAEHIAH
jgi:4a-hydroxytetrahydrobiopterin dehydratase